MTDEIKIYVLNDILQFRFTYTFPLKCHFKYKTFIFMCTFLCICIGVFKFVLHFYLKEVTKSSYKNNNLIRVNCLNLTTDTKRQEEEE